MAVNPRKNRYGKMIRFNAMASSHPATLSSGAVKVWMTCGEKMTPETTTTASTSATVQKKRFAKNHRSSAERSRIYVVNTGINVAENVASPTKRLKRLGIRYAR